MKTYVTIHAVLATALLFAPACGDDKGSTDTDATTTTNETTDTTASTTDTTGPTGTVTTEDETATTTTTTAPTTTTSPTTTNGTTDTGGDDGFVFPTEPFDAYTQIDRHGAVEAGTAGIAAAQGLGFNMGSDISIRDDYNASNPVEDAAGMWLPEIGASITFFHDAFDDDLMMLNLVPATVQETVDQAGPVIVPDTIKYDPSKPTGYPNGRALTDPVVDITLAAVLLKLGPDQPLTLFADLPLNPPENDVPFKAEFPFLAPPHL
ncbi:DUF4331 family protein [Nannocystis sp. ILAH1]|uniref:DUF4331 family protein n=1 Tax=unclassified Nannocystis TaxID=2627009 RepID=UPI00226D8C22|nr:MULTISPECIES: DUF4331 family protein [unclassified Nannocystis]MCY0987044.1 DUF4331 family protein [Nannocystis sp. ILAH1]MCY1071927.1 DUF4331 family protein [Nannocystis sp. RBIL2]